MVEAKRLASNAARLKLEDACERRDDGGAGA